MSEFQARAPLPPRDRRRGKRYLTKKNVFFAAVALSVMFTALLVMPDLRGERSSGGLWGISDNPAGEPVEPVVEGAVAREGYTDPLLVETARRSELLGVDRYSQQRPPGDDWFIEDLGGSHGSAKPGEPALSRENRDRKKKAEFAITGGAEGVKIEPAVD